jgi:hypothetical protein
MRNLLIGVLLGGAVCAPASASDWMEVANDNETVVYIDRSSIRPIGQHVSFWEMTRVKPAAKRDYGERRTLWLLDCQRQSLAIKSIVAYEKSGQVYAGPNTTADYALEWDAIIPDSLGEIYRNFICARDSS